MDIDPQFRLFRFGDFVCDVDKGELRDGQGVPCLTGKPFDVLVYLAMNHHRLVPVEELLELFWSDDRYNADEEGADPQNAHQAISRIRSATGDDPRKPSYIQTRRGRGFRFIAPLRFQPQAVEPSAVIVASDDAPSPQSSGLSGSKSSRRFRYVTVLVIGASVAIFGILFLPLATPRVVSSAPLTHTGYPKYAPVITDGDNLYFTEFAFGQYRIVRFDQASKQTSTVSTSVPNPYLCDFLPGRKLLLVRGVAGGFDDYGPLFMQGLDGKAVEPLPITAFDGSWAPNGNSLVYARGGEVSIFDLHIKKSKVIARVNGYSWWPRWAPDGRRLRFTVSDGATQATSLWEVRADGTNLHQMFKPKDPWFHASSGSWVANGRYFLFQVGPLSNSNLWALDEGLLSALRKHNPFQLTSGPSLRGPALASDGQTVFARSQVYRGELKKIDIKTGSQTAFPTQAIADTVSFSPDGLSLVYCVADQEQSLWLSKADGSSPRILVPPPFQSAFPQWSPKGDQIALVTRRPGEPWKITLVNPASAKVEQLDLLPTNVLHPSWSPDGKQLVFGTIPTINESVYLYAMDTETRLVSIIPGSQGLFTPALSPDGQYIAALRADSYQLMLFNRRTSQWDSLVGSKFGYPVWSPDSKDIYSFRNGAGGPHFYRIDVATKAAKEILYLPGFQLLDRWIGLDRDGSLLAARNTGIMEIYALHLDSVLR